MSSPSILHCGVIAHSYLSPRYQIRSPTNKISKTDGELKEFESILENHRAKGTEDNEIARKVQKSRKKGGKAAAAPARRTARRKAQSTPPSSPER